MYALIRAGIGILILHVTSSHAQLEATPTPPGLCPGQGGVYYWLNNACYYPMLFFTLDWSTAESICQAQQAHLASIHSAAENQFILSLMEGHGIEKFWVGMSKLDPDRHQYWTDASPTDYFNWYPGQPDNGNVGGVESCIELFTSDDPPFTPGSWNDDRCDQLRHFVCQSYASNYTAPTYTFPPIPTNEYCRPGWQQFRGRCYKFFGSHNGDTPLSFDDAFHACRNLSDVNDYDRSNLVAIRDVYDQMYLDSMMWNYTQDVWIGLWVQGYDNTKTTDWYDDKTPYIYTNYGPNGVPFDAGGCVKMHTEMANLGEWQVLSLDDGSDPLNYNEALDCTDPQGYICMQYTDPTISTPPPTPVPTIQCPNGFDAYGLETCYSFFADSVDVNSAQTACEALSSSGFNAELASIIDPYELAYIVSRAQEQNIESFWIGLWQSSSGQFRWLDGWPVGTTLWGPGQPLKDPNLNAVIMTLNANNTEWGAYWSNVNSNAFISQYPYLCKLSRKAYEPPTPGPVGCATSGGWIEGHQACYLIQPQQMSFYQAEVFCAENHPERPTHLASFHSLYEVYFLRQQPSFWNTTDRYHIGLAAIQQGGHLSWTDSSPLDFVNWAANQPVAVPGESAQCVTMDTNGQWYMNDCSFDTHMYICMQQKFLNTTATTAVASTQTAPQSTTRSGSQASPTNTPLSPVTKTSGPTQSAPSGGPSSTKMSTNTLSGGTSGPTQGQPPSKGLTPGAQAGVAIAVIIGIALLLAVGYVVYKRYPMWSTGSTRPLIGRSGAVGDGTNPNYENMRDDI